jgi:hypothetical protein
MIARFPVSTPPVTLCPNATPTMVGTSKSRSWTASWVRARSAYSSGIDGETGIGCDMA